MKHRSKPKRYSPKQIRIALEKANIKRESDRGPYDVEMDSLFFFEKLEEAALKFRSKPSVNKGDRK